MIGNPMNDDPTKNPNDLGPCCICGQVDPTVRTIILLPRKGPMPGRGWGCVACGLPPDGAVAVICDKCAALPDPSASLRFACRGHPGTDGRLPIGDLPAEPHQHDLSRHPEQRQNPASAPSRETRALPAIGHAILVLLSHSRIGLRVDHICTAFGRSQDDVYTWLRALRDEGLVTCRFARYGLTSRGQAYLVELTTKEHTR